MFDVVLYQPEIPANTGNIVRLCANAGAGLDYHELAPITQHDSWQDCVRHFAGRRAFALSTRAAGRYDRARFQPGDVLVFGPETRGLPQALIETFAPDRRLRVPMAGESRSINLANAVAIVLYEAWRQQGFGGNS